MINVVGPILIGLTVLIIRGFSSNSWIRRRLAFVFLLMVSASLLGLAHVYQRDAILLDIELLVALAGVLLSLIVLVLNPLKKDQISERFPSIVQDAMVIGVVFLILLYWWPDRFLTTSAVGALIIGLALQDTLGNLFAGLALQVEKPFFVGDWVQLDQLEGRVIEITWRATKIRSRSGNFHIIPNTVIAKGDIVNCTHPSKIVRIERTIGFGYEVPPNQIKDTVMETIKGIPEVLKQPAPDVLLDSYSDFSIAYRCRFWIGDFGKKEEILDKFATQLYYRLARAGIQIPFPIRDVHLQESLAARERPTPDRDTRLRFLSGIDLFAALASEMLEKVADGLEHSSYAKEESLVYQGDEGDCMFFIDEGQARVIVEHEGVSSQVATLEEGQYFGEMALLTGEKRAATVVAATDLEVFILGKEALGRILEENPEVAEELSRVVAERQATLTATAEEVEQRKSQREQIEKSLLERIQQFFKL